VSNHIISIAEFATIVATKDLLLPLLSEFERFAVYLLLKFNSNSKQLSVATCGEWRQGWTTLINTIKI
jgi:hypothetical protein